MADELETHLLPDIGRQLLQILLVLLRQENGPDAGPVRGQDLLLDAADGQHTASQGDLAGHGDLLANRTLRQGGGDGGRNGDSGGRPVFGNATGRNMDMDIELTIELLVDSQL